MRAGPDPHLKEILGQPDALRRAGDAVRDGEATLGRVADAAAERDRAILTGMGSSFDACFPGLEHLAARGVVALHASAAEILHFRVPWITAGSILVLVSQSGGSAEVVPLAERARAAPERPVIVTVTNGLANELVDH
ncbi:MAG: SIS domain-containing protein, partial [Actinomycetota bacterium]